MYQITYYFALFINMIWCLSALVYQILIFFWNVFVLKRVVKNSHHHFIVIMWFSFNKILPSRSPNSWLYFMKNRTKDILPSYFTKPLFFQRLAKDFFWQNRTMETKTLYRSFYLFITYRHLNIMLLITVIPISL